MLNAPKDTGKRMRAYLSILLVPPVAGALCFASILLWMCSSLGPRRLWREDVPPWALVPIRPPTVGVEGGAGGVVFELEAPRPDELRPEGERVEELPEAPMLEEVCRVPLTTVLLLLPPPLPPLLLLLAVSAFLESLLDSE